jgi:hypothetical protein
MKAMNQTRGLGDPPMKAWSGPHYRQVHIAHRTMALKLMQCDAHRKEGGGVQGGPIPGKNPGP